MLDIYRFVISPDSQNVVYAERQNNESGITLFIAPIDGSRTPQKIGAPSRLSGLV
jgi:hypothetical protein